MGVNQSWKPNGHRMASKGGHGAWCRGASERAFGRKTQQKPAKVTMKPIIKTNQKQTYLIFCLIFWGGNDGGPIEQNKNNERKDNISCV